LLAGLGTAECVPAGCVAPELRAAPGRAGCVVLLGAALERLAGVGILAAAFASADPPPATRARMS